MSATEDLMNENHPKGSVTYFIVAKFKKDKKKIIRFLWNFHGRGRGTKSKKRN